MIDFRLLLRFKGQKISKPNCDVLNNEQNLPDSGQNRSNPMRV